MEKEQNRKEKSSYEKVQMFGESRKKKKKKKKINFQIMKTKFR